MEKEDAASVGEDEEQAENLCRKDTPGPMPEYQYDREELFRLQDVKLSRCRPKCLDRNFDTAEGLWDPEKWFRSLCGGSRENSPITVVDGRDRRRPHDVDRDIMSRNRKASSSDPKERLKEEQDGIVLSPQRRNFSTGCQVSKTSSSIMGSGGPSIYRQSSLNDYKERDDRERDRRDQRRIGSGRIQIDRDQGRDREREYLRYEREDRDRGDRERDRIDRDMLDRDRDRNRIDRDRDRRYVVERSDRFRRGDNRDFGDKMAERRDRDFRDRDRDRDDRRYSHGGRRRNHHEEETPEWFTGGPTSQTETIELRGFERESEKARKQHREREEEEGEEVEVEVEAEVEAADEEYPEKDKLVPGTVDGAGDAKENARGSVECNGAIEIRESCPADNPAVMEVEQHPQRSSPRSAALFDFNEFFNIEHIPGLGPVQDLLPDPRNDGPGVHDTYHNESGSRFSKWFTAQALSASNQAGSDAENFSNSNINSNLMYNHRNSPANLSDDFNYLNDMLEGGKSPVGPSPPPHGGNQMYGEKPFFHPFPINKDSLTHSSEHNSQMKHFTPVVSVLFQNSALEKSGNASTPSSRGSFSTQDAEAQLKAMLFGGARDSASSSGTASPANVPPGVQRKMKTVAELEADMHQNSPQSPASTPHSTPAPMGSGAPPAGSDDGDQSAFNRLLSLMKVGSGGSAPPVPRMPDQRSLSPSFGVQAHNEFTQALLRNKEQQLQIQQQTLQSMQQPLPQSQMPPAQLPQAQLPQSQVQAQTQAQAEAQAQQLHHHLQQQQQQHQQAGLQAQGVMSKVPIIQHPSQQPPQQPPHIVVPHPVLPQGVGRVPQGQSQDPIMNFLQQNPKIVMKPASPIPGMVAGHTSAQGPVPSPLPPGLPPPSIRVTSQQGNNPATARVPSPIMFSQQPPMHLSAPSPIHPVQLAPLAGQALSSNTLTTTSGMRSPVLQRVPSPQELKAHTQAIMQTALIKRKLEDQKERYLKKQQERDKSPSQSQIAPTVNKTTAPAIPTTPTTVQSKPAIMAFTPTSVIRKMHSDRVTEKEKQAKESDEDSGENARHGLEKQGSESFEDSAVGSGEMGLEPSDLHTPSSFNSNMSALSSQMEEGLHFGSHDESPFLHHGHEGFDDKMVLSGAPPVTSQIKSIPVIRPMVGQPVAPPPSASGGRPIVKGSGEPVSSGPPAVPPPQPRPVTGGAPPPAKSDNEPRPITGSSGSSSGVDLNKFLEQHQQQRLQQQAQQAAAVLPPHISTPIARSLGAGPAPPPPFMPITPGPIPIQAATQASMQNAMIMQQINRVNAMNQMNQLAALQAQHRMIDPRLQPLRAVIPTVNAAAPMSPLSPRSSLPSAIPGLAPPNSSAVAMSAGLKRSFSPAHPIFSQANKPVMNGPFSMGAPVSGAPSNCVPSEGEILKWFGPEMLKTQLPSMPPLPTHGTKVMTVDEIERS